MFKINSLLLSTAFIVGVATSGNAAFNVIVNSNGGPLITSPSGSNLSAGSLVRVGTFSTDPGTIGLDLTALEAAFTAFGEDTTTTNDGVVSQAANPGGDSPLVINDTASAGNIFGQIQNVDNTFAGGEGNQLYVWAIDSSDVSTATALGIFSDPAWTVPALGAANLNTANIDDPATDIDLGSLGPNGEVQLLALAPIPEPSAALLILASGFGLFFRRRKV